MDNLFVTHEQALELKDLGFKDSCFGEWRQWDGGYPWLQLYQDLDGCSTDDSDYQYTTEALAPLKSQVFEWFRKEKDLYCEIRTFAWDYDKKELGFSIRTYLNPIDIETERLIHSEVYETYEEAESACIDKLIEIVKSKKQ